jgi:carboxylate-amine ligase
MATAALPAWSRWADIEEPFSVGIEEEVMLLDPADMSLVQDFEGLREHLSADLAQRLTPETHRASVELSSEPRKRVADAAFDLAQLRLRLEGELKVRDVDLAASGTHPSALWNETEVSEDDRYRYVLETMRVLALREPTHALHVHVGVEDCEQATEVCNSMRAHLPLLLAVSANSPFWQGRDTGLASARTPIFSAFPRVGIPRRFNGYRDYAESLQVLIGSGAIPEPTFVWWDVRLQPRYGTVEVRIMDAQTESWRTAAIAALVQCTVRLEAREGYASAQLVASPEAIQENRFIASRDGVGAALIDPVSGELVSAEQQISDLLAACAPHAQALDCEGELADVRRILAEPGDKLQRRWAGSTPDLMTLLEQMRDRFSVDPSSRRAAET